jgi:hypothetical protein
MEPEWDDAALVASLRQKRSAALVALLQRHGRDVKRRLGRMLGVDPELADLTREVFLRALQIGSASPGEDYAIVIELPDRFARTHRRALPVLEHSRGPFDRTLARWRRKRSHPELNRGVRRSALCPGCIADRP